MKKLRKELKNDLGNITKPYQAMQRFIGTSEEIDKSAKQIPSTMSVGINSVETSGLTKARFRGLKNI